MKYKILIILIAVVFFGAGLYYLFKTETITNYPSKGKDIIAFGDSLVEGVGSTPKNDFVSLLSNKIGKPIVNLGKSGDTTADGILRINQIDSYNPKVVIILLGGNDYLKKVPIEDTRKNLKLIIENIEARGSIVLLLGVPSGVLSDRYEEEFEALQEVYHTAYVSNVLSGLLDKPEYMSDYVHPNDKGYALIADKIYPVLKGLLK